MQNEDDFSFDDGLELLLGPELDDDAQEEPYSQTKKKVTTPTPKKSIIKQKEATNAPLAFAQEISIDEVATKEEEQSAPKNNFEPKPPMSPAPQKRKKRVRIGDALREKNLISEDQLSIALKEKEGRDIRIGEMLVELGFISENVLTQALAEQSGYEEFNIEDAVVSPETLALLPKETAQKYRVFPISLTENKLFMAMADIYDVIAIDQVERLLPYGTEIVPQVTSDADIQAAIDKYYGHELSIDGILKEIEQGGQDKFIETGAYNQGDYEHPLVRLVNSILYDAVKVKASDLHFEPEGNYLRLRYRIDGVMTQIRTIHKSHWPAISHRLKIMAGMNIADKLNSQDGRVSLVVDTRRIDFRVSSLPTIHGENIVMRILDKGAMQIQLEDLGFSEGNRKLIKQMLLKPEGILIVTGPTGSGKTTTLYSMMNHINSLDINIMTLEDPVEYELPLIRQAQIREGTSMNFAEGIRTLLRQDPDVILVGEVRDSETASMALRAAMTGHQVHTTLHTNDAAGALPRLMDLGMKPSLMAGNIIGVIAQRLCRKLCTSCMEIKEASPEECEALGLDPKKPPRLGYAKGCSKCRQTGYTGRVAVAEIIPMNTEIDELLVDGVHLSKVKNAATRYGYVPMALDGKQKILDRTISLDSLMASVDISMLRTRAEQK
jgi:general secretion pathway protein E/type IV pilus assembly protein PilB